MKQLFVLGIAVLLLVAPGCKSGAGSAATVMKSPGFNLGDLEVLAYLGLGSSVEDAMAVAMMGPVLEGHLQAAPHDFVILSASECARRASLDGVQELHRDVLDFWLDHKKVDKLKMQQLCSILGVQAILVGVIEDWIQSRGSTAADEAAHTQITASLSIYSAATGRREWRARSTVMRAAQQFETSDRDTGRGSRMSGIGSKRDMAGLSANLRSGSAPPRFEEVIPEVAAELAEAMVP
ncbi:MAG: hypothetical protein KAY24_05660 [Candidatus Eisenbacteria sp.]|nr:hypothetical protein [Candidatus Eisenbacteria bacterium]